MSEQAHTPTVGELLATYDAAISDCPVNNPSARRGGFDASEPCPVCTARQDQNCGREVSASYQLIKSLRDLAGRATPSKSGGK